MWKHFLNSFSHNAKNSFVTFLLMFSISSNLHHFSMGLILGNKKNSGGDKSGEYGGGLILESLVLSKTALLILQCEALHWHARGTSSSFLKLEHCSKNSLNRKRYYFHTIFLIHCIIWRNKFFVNDSLIGEECDQHHFAFWLLK